MDIELKPCPCCGSNNVRVRPFRDYVLDMLTDINEDIIYDYEEEIDEYADGYNVVCYERIPRVGTCLTTGGWAITMKNAAEKWNKRDGDEPKTMVILKRTKGTFKDSL
jgi:hypothetical protein